MNLVKVVVTFQDPSEDKSQVEFDLIEILVRVGDAVRRGDPLAQIETDKAVGDVEAPADGVVREIFLKAGETYHYGEILCVIEESS